MANRLLNEYGVMHHDTPEGQTIEQIAFKLRNDIKNTIKLYNFSPEELIVFKHQLESELSATFAEELILYSIRLRRKNESVSAANSPA